ncbi:MAG: hypothetical protein ASARMPREDX12_007020 [Alectoria sarmentosa]|nr:MAG: hypothetical protein ASARMPREDX12_007020 [Alectoria sarmentosa]
MVLPAGFQLGLELTNIINPISQAMSALGSLALIDAIKKSGSDFITETKLASLIGRLRIDPVIKVHFRKMVAKSDQSLISRYLDIVLESGSGPTVQEALKNPALFSMVIQLSGLAFAHEDESLANAIVEAVEKIVQESHGDIGIVPDYVSLLGTVRACQQQTAAFRWALLYEAVEEKICNSLANFDSHRSNSPEGPLSKKSKTDHRVTEYPKSVRYRSLPVPVLQGLLMWLQSLQGFPEHRFLHVRCDTGISTVVVWCHHILGLNLMINIQGVEIHFGDEPYNLVVEDVQSKKAGVSLMDPLDPPEPLFTLQDDPFSTGISYEHRAEAYGYGAKLLRLDGYSEEQVQECAQKVVSHTIERYGACRPSHEFSDADTKSRTKVGDPTTYYPCENKLLCAGRFLFALDEDTIISSPESADTWDYDGTMTALSAIVITFARIPEDELTGCREIPLALNVLDILPLDAGLLSHLDPEDGLNLSKSFKILSYLLLGRHMCHDDYVKSSVLVSAWGWSVFLDSIDSVDPIDVPINTLRVLRGVPTRQGFRRSRIIDGPHCFRKPRNLHPLTIKKLLPHLVPEVSKATRDAIFVGRRSDAFQVTQNFTCDARTCGFGFREMTEWVIRSRALRPCKCSKFKHGLSTLASKHITSSTHKVSAIDNLIDMKTDILERAKPLTTNEPLQCSDSERVFVSKDLLRVFFYVSENPAARWLQLAILYWNLRHVERSRRDYHVVLGGPDTCVDCAVRNSASVISKTVILL